MVGTDHLVAKADIGARPQEQRTVVGHALEEVVRVARHDLYMLGGQFVGLGQHFLVAVADDHLAIDLPGLAGDGCRRQDLELAFDLSHGVARQCFGGGQKHRRRSGAVLGLAQQIHCAHFAIHRFVRDHQGFGRPSKQVDPNPAVQLALGFGHEHIARPDQHVHRRHRLGANGHGRHRLHAAQHQNLIRASEVHGRHDGRMRRTLVRRRGRHHTRHASHLGREHAHVGRGNQRVLAAGHIAAHRLHRDILVTQHHAGHGLDLDIHH